MPSHPRSPRPRALPTLAPLVVPTAGPSNGPESAPLLSAGPLSPSEHTPLLRSMRSFGPDELRRKSQRLSSLLFQHDDASATAAAAAAAAARDPSEASPLLPPPTTPIRSNAEAERGRDDRGDWVAPWTPRTAPGRSLSRGRSSYFGTAGVANAKSVGGGYDAEFRADLEKGGGSGVRSWYGESARKQEQASHPVGRTVPSAALMSSSRSR